jgi:dipeptidyl aminopeptidase/acylaminoacyl peptidase
VSNAQISPDGARIVYTRLQANKIEDRWDSSLWIMNADGSQHRFLPKAPAPAGLRTGKRILYIADGEPRGPQIFVRWIDTDGAATQVTHATEKVADARWSPDGKSIAFSMFVPEKDTWNISMPAAPEGAQWTGSPRIVDTLHYRQDQVGFLQDGQTQLFVVSADGGAPRQITSGKWSAGAGELRGAVPMDWTPDSKAIVFEGDRSADADLHYQISQLLVADIAAGTIRELVAKPGSWSRPAVSPDGKAVAFTGYPQSKSTHSVADLYVIPFAGGEMRKISGNYDRDPLNLHWTPDSAGVYFDAEDRGSRNAQFAAIAGGGVKPVTAGAHVLTMDSASSDLMAVGTETDPENPPDVVRYNLRRPGEITKLTSVNAGLLAGMHLAKTEEIDFTSSGNAKVQGWVVKPPDFDPRRSIRSSSKFTADRFPCTAWRSTTCSRISPPTISWCSTQSARQHRIWHGLLRRHRPQLSGARLRRSDGRSGRDRRQGVHR